MQATASAGTIATGAASLPVAQTRGEIEQTLYRAAEARTEVLENYRTEEIVEIIVAAADAWQRPHYGLRREVVQALAGRLALPVSMLEEGIDAIFSVVNHNSLVHMIAREAEDPAAMDDALVRGDGARRRLAGPPLVVHTLAGNVPGLSIPPLVACLLARSICMIRESARQPLLTSAFATTLAQYSPELASMIVPVHWRAGDTALEQYVFAEAGRIEVMGSDRTVQLIASRHPEQKIVRRGTTLSIGLVPESADTDSAAVGFAHDIVFYDGLGCLTPHVILVEGPEQRAHRMARLLAIALERQQRLWPREQRDFELESRRRAFLGNAEVSAACHPNRLLLRGRDDAWLVHFCPEAPLAPGPGLRCITVASCETRGDIERALARPEAPLAAVGLALAPDHREYREVLTMLRRARATLVCAPGEMQRPPIYWAQDGRQRLADLLDWRSESEL